MYGYGDTLIVFIYLRVNGNNFRKHLSLKKIFHVCQVIGFFKKRTKI